MVILVSIINIFRKQYVRIIMNTFLYNLPVNSEIYNITNPIIIKLLEYNNKFGSSDIYMVHSDQHLKLIRCWQSLCLCSKFINDDIVYLI